MDNLNSYIEEIEKLKKENEDLKSKVIDVLFEMNYNKQTELIEFIREIYISIDSELTNNSKLSKKDILINLKKYIKEFMKNNNLKL